MKKTLILIPLITLGLFSCSNGTISTLTPSEELLKDIKILKDTSVDDFISEDSPSLTFGIYFNKENTQDNKAYVYSCYIDYTNTQLDNFKMFSVPSSYLSTAESKNIPLIGYSTNVTLSEVKDETNNKFNKIKLSIQLTNEEPYLYAFIKYSNGQFCFRHAYN